MGTATVRKLASHQALELEALLVIISDLTVFWHVPISVLFWNWTEHEINVYRNIIEL